MALQQGHFPPDKNSAQNYFAKYAVSVLTEDFLPLPPFYRVKEQKGGMDYEERDCFAFGGMFAVLRLFHGAACRIIRSIQLFLQICCKGRGRIV